MVKNNNTLNYKLHKFLGESHIYEQLYELYVDFSLRSVPLPTKEITFSGRFEEMKKHFDFLAKNTIIMYAVVNNEISGFVAFGSDFSHIDIPENFKNLIEEKKEQIRELSFGASLPNKIFLAQKIVRDSIQFIKKEYNINYIIGTVVREKKKDKFMLAIKRIFKFSVINNFTFHEIS